MLKLNNTYYIKIYIYYFLNFQSGAKYAMMRTGIIKFYKEYQARFFSKYLYKIFQPSLAK